MTLHNKFVKTCIKTLATFDYFSFFITKERWENIYTGKSKHNILFIHVGMLLRNHTILHESPSECLLDWEIRI